MTIQEKVQRDQRFTRIGKGVYALTKFIAQVEKGDIGYFKVTDHNEMVFKSNISPKTKIFKSTEKEVYQKIRKGQSSFRNLLLNEMKKCPITGIDDKRLLVASHIKPWIHSNNQERLNAQNGILLSPLFDKLFDKGVGLITFTDKKEILDNLSKENIERLNICPNQIIVDLDISGREKFLEYHRENIFQG